MAEAIKPAIKTLGFIEEPLLEMTRSLVNSGPSAEDVLDPKELTGPTVVVPLVLYMGGGQGRAGQGWGK